MKLTRMTTRTLIAVGAVSLLAITMSLLNAQAPAAGVPGVAGGARGAAAGRWPGRRDLYGSRHR